MSDAKKNLEARDWSPDAAEAERLAYFYYEQRGYAHGFHEEDWHRAVEELRRRRTSLDDAGKTDRTVLGVSVR